MSSGESTQSLPAPASAQASSSFTWLRPGVVALCLLPAAVAGPLQAAEEEYFKAYTISSRAHVRVHADDSSVRVITSDSRQVELRTHSEGDSWGLSLGGRPHVESHQDGDVVELTESSSWHMVLGVSTRRTVIEVRMPRNADLEIQTGDGSVELSSLDGNIEVHTSDGGIRATQLGGRIELRSSDGDIITDSLQGDLRLHTSDGLIRAAHLAGRCEAGTDDGSIQVAGRFDQLDLRSGDGNITALVEPGSQIASTWRLRTSDGSLHVTLPRDFRANIEASTGDGHITLEMPVKIQGEVSQRKVRGTLNGGGPALLIHSADGSIDLAAD
jgi:hypothetical protein